MRNYLLCVTLIVIFISVYGFIVPYMVSAKDTVSVLIGMGIAVVVGPLSMWAIGKYTCNQLFKKEEKK